MFLSIETATKNLYAYSSPDKAQNTNSTYVTLLKVLMMTKQSVMSKTILAGTTSVGIRKLTQDITTKMAVGK